MEWLERLGEYVLLAFGGKSSRHQHRPPLAHAGAFGLLLLSYLQRGLRSASDSSCELDIASLCARVNAEVMDALSDIEVSDNTEDNGMPPRKRTRRTRRPAVVVDDSDSHSDDGVVEDDSDSGDDVNKHALMSLTGVQLSARPSAAG